jgi:hypothetical protein
MKGKDTRGTQQRARVPRAATRIGLIVEGETEFRALPKLHQKKLVAACPLLHAISLGGVGSSASPQGIAKQLKPKVLEHYSRGIRKVVVCIDLEQRRDCPGAFAQAIHSETHAIVTKKAPELDLHVVIANRTFEAWLLAGADELHAKGLFKRRLTTQPFEGRIGEQQKMGVVELTKLLERPYLKTKDGPALFAQLDFAKARSFKPPGRGSQSLDKLLRTLGI